MWIIGAIIGVGAPITGWVFTMIFNKLEKHNDKFETHVQSHIALDNKIDRHKLHAAETFATKVDVKDGFDRIMTKLDGIDNKLDRKVDK